MSVVYSGTSIQPSVWAYDRVTKLPIQTPTCTFNFFAPPKDPEWNPTDRTADYTCPGTFDPNQNKYVGSISTEGWIGGKWYVQAVLTQDPYTVWDYYQFTIRA